MRKHSRTKANARGLRRSLASGHQHSQGPNTQLNAFIGKEKLTEKWPPITSLPEAAGVPSRESRKEGATKLALRRLRCTGQNQCVWSCRTVHQGDPTSGSKHHQGSSLHSPRSAEETAELEQD